MVEKLIKVGHLGRYIREIDHGVESEPVADKVITVVATPSESRPAINYILGGPSDYQYQLKRQQKRLLRAATVKAQINAIHAEGRHEETKPIGDPISFPPVNPNMIIVRHYDALLLTLCINGFDVHRVLIDLGSATDLVQLPTFKHMKLSLGVVNSAGRVLFDFNGATTITLGDVALLVKARPVTQQVLFSIVEDLGPYNAITGRTWLTR